MKRLIMLPGMMDGVFFKNEIPYFRTEFDRITVLTYPGNNSILKKIAAEYDLEYYQIKSNKIWRLVFSFGKVLSSRDLEFQRERQIAKKKARSFIEYIKNLLYMSLYVSFSRECQKVYNTIKQDKVEDYFYSFWLSRGAYAICNLKKKSAPKARAIARAHRYDLYEEMSPTGYLPFREFISNEMDGICFISRNGLSYYNERYNHKADLEYIYLGSADLKCKETKDIKESGLFTIVSCSSMISVKRIDLIINALSGLDFDYQWIHIGDGPEKKIISELAKIKIKRCYKLVGRMDNRDIGILYEDIKPDLFLNLSDSEGIPVSVMEAFSCAIPVVARNVGGMSEIVDDTCGILIDGKCDDEVITSAQNAIEKIAEMKRISPNVYEHMRKSAREKWEKEFDVKRNTNRFISEMLMK